MKLFIIIRLIFFFSFSMKTKSKTCNSTNHHWREPPAATRASFRQPEAQRAQTGGIQNYIVV